ncbi:UDP-N-acetylglucosamine--N-acetylmuramyl-(pentapeptide) pyrophosphoryl-undecaprenol N-acetylglucosamine transferase [Actinacidiphila sp. ITFR-21]|uniref:UDP-N-acetylglucosamine--N-acetylmuramyl- (pentapeptide) pyrophosphoryl-undecaprenol N-acetylglucosamine transferase n=1 Tax=Actinacidiphila sp. ITFR-21 TaxID=3075199 RepID=UPI00288B5E33|nr:UDP-N-acetylglucosamine--N-acetylmuramyl-(pentapeptide) pyrophosphoryl-undecaprenol N-acetylglucosamine transferase [Streptomyces sp. ITFR-21]WNI19615.1 UDP-N-acetylglucosamine--N-acetylmuramyl-(pentapeptide) pyrophosphoryl-undecaprenol N-acetylglucosamine transferase [Streptomyces sp. ITFR-21]
MIVTGGGSGGHTYPALTAVRTLRSRLTAVGRPLDVLWVGAADSLESRVAEGEGIRFASVVTGRIRRTGNPLKTVSPANVKDMSRVPLGIAQARRIVADFHPDVVLATGGQVAVPVGLAARLCRRPLVVHEQTVRLDLANRSLAHRATRVAVSSEETLPLLAASARATAEVTGNPVRPEILSGQADKAVLSLGLQDFVRRLPTVYVTGGAQGSPQLNELVRDVLPWLLCHANVVHQCGPEHVAELRQHAATALTGDLAVRYHAVGYVGPELPDVLALADVVVSRSGAGTVAELTALGKAAVLVPLASSAGDEQSENARRLHKAGAAVALLGEVSPDRLRDTVGPLLVDSARRTAMAARSRAQGHPDAADRLVDVTLSAADGW